LFILRRLLYRLSFFRRSNVYRIVFLFLLIGCVHTSHAATVYVNTVYQAVGSSFTLETQSIVLSSSKLVGSNFQFTDNNSPNLFSTGNNISNISGTFKYYNVAGNLISIDGVISRQQKSGSNTLGVYFVSNDGLQAFFLVIPGNESNYTGGQTVNTDSSPMGANLNTVLETTPQLVVTPSSLEAFTTCYGTASNTQTFTVSGSNLTSNITITAPSGFEVSTQSNSNFSSTVLLSQSSGTVSTTTIYIRLSADAAAGSYNETVTINSTNANTGSVSVIGNVNTTSVGGTVSASPSTICSGSITTLSLSGYTGSLQWQSSTNGSSWSNVVGGSGATSTSYVTGSLTATTYYRVEVTSGVCATINSDVATVTVNVTSVGGTVSASPSTVCSGLNTILSVNGYTGSIQWQSSTDGSNWSNVIGGSGATSSSYVTGSLTATTYYRVEVASGECTTISSNVATVTVNATSVGGTVSVSPSTICSGSSTILSLSGYTGSLQWQSSSNGSSWSNVVGGSGASTDTYKTSTLTTTTYYRVAVTSGVCETTNSSLATVIVNDPPTPTISAGGATTFCSGGDVVLTASGGSSYLWSTGATSSSVTVTTSGTYTVTVTDGNGCIATSTATTVTVNALPSAGFITSAITCEKNPITFTSSSLVDAGTLTKWVWDFRDGTTPTTSFTGTITHTYSDFNTYNPTLVVESSNGCISVPVSISLNVNPLPITGFSLPEVCLPRARAVFINNTIIPDNSSMTYRWDFGDILDNSASVTKDGVHTFTALGTYQVKLIVTSVNSCKDSITRIFKDVFPQPKAGFSSADSACVGIGILFTDTSSTVNGTFTNWYWELGDKMQETKNIFSYTYNTEGTYTINLYARTSIGCYTDTISKRIMIFAYPRVNAGPDLFVLDDGQEQIKATATGSSLVYKWTPTTYLSDSNILNPFIIRPKDSLIYRLTVTDKGNCSAYDEMKMIPLEMPRPPNTFTPNGDGVNDNWQILNLKEYEGCIVEIYTSSGKLIYRSIGYTKPWDGSFNGKPVPAGTYYYVIDPKSGRQKQAGYITIFK